MTLAALDLDATAALIGRGGEWLRRHWPRLKSESRFPAPIHEQGTLVWDRAHVYAWLDRERPVRERAFCAAFRAAYDAAAASDPALDDHIAASRRELDRRRAALRLEG